jgi:hypothetical protein
LQVRMTLKAWQDPPLSGDMSNKMTAADDRNTVKIVVDPILHLPGQDDLVKVCEQEWVHPQDSEYVVP